MVGSHIPRENSWDVECICGTLHIQIWKDWECVIQESDRDKGRVTETASLEWPLSMQQYLAKHFTSWAALVRTADLSGLYVSISLIDEEIENT